MALEYKNYLNLGETIEGKELQQKHLSDIMNNGTFLPMTISYKDIDNAFKNWVDKELTIIDKNGSKFPTMVLFSNQRFSEYTQSWRYTDSNNNLLLNFKTVTRENTPQYGTIQTGLFNIPGDNRYYTIEKKIVLDDNGSESFVVLKMRQPTAINLMYTVSIFTTQYESINEFNILINKAFRSKQCYIKPNEHFMPMTLEGISDSSSNNIDDRQFYGQTYQIKVLGYIITEDDYRVEEIPLKNGFSIPMMNGTKNLPDVEIEECNDNGKERITILFPEKCSKNSVTFMVDTDFVINEITVDNIFNNFKLFINDNLVDKTTPITLKKDDEIKIVISKQEKNKQCKITLF